MDKLPDKKSNQSQPTSYAGFEGAEEASSKAFANNKKIINITESFIVDGSQKLAAFLRKKLSIELSSLSTCLFEAIEHDAVKTVTVGFQIEPSGKFGFIMFDLALLHAAINLLYGGQVGNKETVIKEAGRAGGKIANKIAELCLSVFQDTLNEHLKMDMGLSHQSVPLYLVFNQKLDMSCTFAFKVSIEGVSGRLHLVIPETILASIITESITDNDLAQDDNDSEYHFSGQLKQDLIDSKVTIYAVLPDVSLLVKDVVNLQAGDIIPIGDPTLVYVTHNQKKLFKATARQLNSRRIVEIVDKLSD